MAANVAPFQCSLSPRRGEHRGVGRHQGLGGEQHLPLSLRLLLPPNPRRAGHLRERQRQGVRQHPGGQAAGNRGLRQGGTGTEGQALWTGGAYDGVAQVSHVPVWGIILKIRCADGYHMM